MTQLESVDLFAATAGSADARSHPLDHAAWASLTGPHRHLAEGTTRVLRYPPDVSPIVAIPPIVDEEVWSHLHALVGSGAVVAFAGGVGQIPAGWDMVFKGAGVQLIATDALRTDEPSPEEIVALGAADAAEMVELVARTKPGPFEARTYVLGGYVGIRRGGALVAMVGERLHPPGWTEISAVCTDAGHRRQGLATALVRAVAGNIRRRGDTPFLHSAKSNVNAIRLYESLGFRIRREAQFTAVRTPASQPPDVGLAGTLSTERTS